MNHYSSRARGAGRALVTSLAAMIVFCGTGELIVQQVSPKCPLSCLADTLIAWVLHVSAFV